MKERKEGERLQGREKGGEAERNREMDRGYREKEDYRPSRLTNL